MSLLTKQRAKSSSPNFLNELKRKMSLEVIGQEDVQKFTKSVYLFLSHYSLAGQQGDPKAGL